MRSVSGLAASLRGVFLAAGLYFTLAFSAGFVLGTFRVFLIAPRLGELSAVLFEMPIMLLASWLACGIAIRAFDVSGAAAGLAMGAIAFALLILAEVALARLAFDRSLGDYLRGLATNAGAIGLAGQIAFGCIPAIRADNHPLFQRRKSGKAAKGGPRS
jgi:hypothetical protein